MPFGVANGVGRGRGGLDGGGNRRNERAVLGINVEHPTVTNRDFVA